ncbi:MAG: hypothetical protein QNJ65_13045 [Xenococcaceae cyanobacterium MO_234.B1]|nr:hypothetical protein [Xenococcaceae cyanobacterium MO_234.B1]
MSFIKGESITKSSSDWLNTEVFFGKESNSDRSIFVNLVSELWSLRSKLEVRSQKSEVGSRKSEVRSQKSEVGSQKSEVRSQKSEAVRPCGRTLRMFPAESAPNGDPPRNADQERRGNLAQGTRTPVREKI